MSIAACLLQFFRVIIYETLKVLGAALADTNTFATADHQSMVNALISVLIDPEEDPFSPHTYPVKLYFQINKYCFDLSVHNPTKIGLSHHNIKSFW